MNNKDISFFLMATSLLTMIPIGYSIRHYIDTIDYIKLSVSLVLVVIIILIARILSKIAFAKNRVIVI